MNQPIRIGVIGGSGLYNMPGFTDAAGQFIDTPYGPTSGAIITGMLNGKRIAFVPRHGDGHTLSPNRLPYRANIYALKSLGVRFCIAVNACGSLREAYEPGHMAIPDQILDYTIGTRARSFFGADVAQHIIAHVPVADPFDETLRQIAVAAVREAGGTAHDHGTFAIVDGPRFSTRAESAMFRQMGCDIIGMTTAPEAFLAREAEIAYASIAHITDYDVWKDEPVNVEMVVTTARRNVDLARRSLALAVAAIDEDTETPSHRALDGAIMTAPDRLDPIQVDALRPLLKRVLQLDDVSGS